MVKLQMSKILNRKVRNYDLSELAVSNFDVIIEAIKVGNIGEALDFLEYVSSGNQRNNDSLVSFAEMVLTRLAAFGEEEVMKILRERYYPVTQELLTTAHNVEEYIQRGTETQRFHHGKFNVREEPDRYVLTYDPCGTGGRLRRTRNVGTTVKAYPWSWGKAGVSYYCCHCCLRWEIIPIELVGYPIRINLPGDKPKDPCIQLFYKKPELIPDEYFSRVGMKKGYSKVKKK